MANLNLLSILAGGAKGFQESETLKLAERLRQIAQREKESAVMSEIQARLGAQKSLATHQGGIQGSLAEDSFNRTNAAEDKRSTLATIMGLVSSGAGAGIDLSGEIPETAPEGVGGLVSKIASGVTSRRETERAQDIEDRNAANQQQREIAGIYGNNRNSDPERRRTTDLNSLLKSRSDLTKQLSKLPVESMEDRLTRTALDKNSVEPHATDRLRIEAQLKYIDAQIRNLDPFADLRTELSPQNQSTYASVRRSLARGRSPEAIIATATNKGFTIEQINTLKQLIEMAEFDLTRQKQYGI